MGGCAGKEKTFAHKSSVVPLHKNQRVKGAIVRHYSFFIIVLRRSQSMEDNALETKEISPKMLGAFQIIYFLFFR
jgi:hypothetical protein